MNWLDDDCTFKATLDGLEARERNGQKTIEQQQQSSSSTASSGSANSCTNQNRFKSTIADDKPLIPNLDSAPTYTSGECQQPSQGQVINTNEINNSSINNNTNNGTIALPNEDELVVGYYFGPIARDTAEWILRECIEGSYLLRSTTSSGKHLSDNIDSNFVLSLCHQKQVLHYKIVKTEDAMFALHGQLNTSINNDELKFTTIDELIENADGLACKPTIPIFRHTLESDILPPTFWGLSEDQIRLAILTKARQWGLSVPVVSNVQQANDEWPVGTSAHQQQQMQQHFRSLIDAIRAINAPAAGPLTQNQSIYGAVASTLSNETIRTLIYKSLHEFQPWFHGQITRDEAERRLDESGPKDGKFLVRERDNCSYAMCISHRRSIKHYRIDILSTGELAIQDGRRFTSLMALVSHYTLMSDGLWCALTEASQRPLAAPVIPAASVCSCNSCCTIASNYPPSSVPNMSVSSQLPNQGHKLSVNNAHQTVRNSSIDQGTRPIENNYGFYEVEPPVAISRVQQQQHQQQQQQLTQQPFDNRNFVGQHSIHSVRHSHVNDSKHHQQQQQQQKQLSHDQHHSAGNKTTSLRCTQCLRERPTYPPISSQHNNRNANSNNHQHNNQNVRQAHSHSSNSDPSKSFKAPIKEWLNNINHKWTQLLASRSFHPPSFALNPFAHTSSALHGFMDHRGAAFQHQPLECNPSETPTPTSTPTASAYGTYSVAPYMSNSIGINDSLPAPTFGAPPPPGGGPIYGGGFLANDNSSIVGSPLFAPQTMTQAQATLARGSTLNPRNTAMQHQQQTNVGVTNSGVHNRWSTPGAYSVQGSNITYGVNSATSLNHHQHQQQQAQQHQQQQYPRSYSQQSTALVGDTSVAMQNLQIIPHGGAQLSLASSQTHNSSNHNHTHHHNHSSSRTQSRSSRNSTLAPRSGRAAAIAARNTKAYDDSHEGLLAMASSARRMAPAAMARIVQVQNGQCLGTFRDVHSIQQATQQRQLAAYQYQQQQQQHLLRGSRAAQLACQYQRQMNQSKPNSHGESNRSIVVDSAHTSGTNNSNNGEPSQTVRRVEPIKPTIDPSSVDLIDCRSVGDSVDSGAEQNEATVKPKNNRKDKTKYSSYDRKLIKSSSIETLYELDDVAEDDADANHNNDSDDEATKRAHENIMRLLKTMNTSNNKNNLYGQKPAPTFVPMPCCNGVTQMPPVFHYYPQSTYPWPPNPMNLMSNNQLYNQQQYSQYQRTQQQHQQHPQQQQQTQQTQNSLQQQQQQQQFRYQQNQNCQEQSGQESQGYSKKLNDLDELTTALLTELTQSLKDQAGMKNHKTEPELNQSNGSTMVEPTDS